MMGASTDYGRHPAEDFARASVNYVDEAGTPLVVEATTSWSYVGAGLRLSMELLGPEYSLSISTLDTTTKVFLSRRLQGNVDEDLVEKQNAEQGLMPIVGNESAEYGYEGENRAFIQSFRDGVQPELDFRAGLEVIELLMACYMSAEQERVLRGGLTGSKHTSRPSRARLAPLAGQVRCEQLLRRTTCLNRR